MELNGTITAGGALYGAFGTDSGNYNDLRNKPSINGVELVGNKTSEDLHIDPGGTTDYEDLENKPQINYTPLEGNLTLDELDIQSKIDFPEDPLRFLDGAGQFRSPDYFSGDYDDLANRPEIAGITLTGDKSLTDLGIQEEINFPSDNTKYLDGEGNFTTPAYFSGDYDDLANRPEIAGITLTGNQSLMDLGIQEEIDFPEDNTLYLDGNGNFTQPFSGDYDDLTDKPQINSVTLEGNKTASDLKLISEMHTASGAEAAIETDDTLPLLSCVSDINPVQDFHGYSKPWAGGAGKNKLNVNINDYTTSGVTITNSDGVITLENTATANVTINLRTDRINISDIGNTYKLVDDGTFTFSTDIYLNIRYYDSNASAISNQSMTSVKSMDLIVPNNAYSFMPMIIVKSGIATNGIVKPMLMLQTETSTNFEPYANICPISGHTDVTVTVASTSGGSGEDYTVSLGSTYYGGNLDVTTGELEVTWGNIASYAGETLPGEWLSSLDEYSPLGNPTTGAQVVYELDTPQNYTLTKEKIITLLGDNYIRSDTGDIEITYVTNVIDPLLKYLLENR